MLVQYMREYVFTFHSITLDSFILALVACDGLVLRVLIC